MVEDFFEERAVHRLVVEGAVQQCLSEALDGKDRCFELVGHVSDKLAPVAFHLLELLDFGFQALAGAVDLPEKRAQLVAVGAGGRRLGGKLVGADLVQDPLEVAEAAVEPDVTRGVDEDGSAQSEQGGAPAGGARHGHCSQPGDEARRGSKLQAQAAHERGEPGNK